MIFWGLSSLTKTIAGLNNNTASLARDNQNRIANIAKLHGASSTIIQNLYGVGLILNCVDFALSIDNTITKSNYLYSTAKRILQQCDNGLTSAVPKKEVIDPVLDSRDNLKIERCPFCDGMLFQILNSIWRSTKLFLIYKTSKHMVSKRAKRIFG